MTERPGADAALAATPGATLASAREAHGLSIAEVAEQMRISPRQVVAIEADRYGELPGAVFVRGFVRNYARLLKLDPVPLLHALEPALGGDVPLRAHEIAGTLPETTRRSHGRLWLGLIVVVVAVLAIAAAYEWWRAREPAIEGSMGATAPAQTPSAPLVPAPEATGPAQTTIPLSPERVTDVPLPPGGEAVPSGEAADSGMAPSPPTPQDPAAPDGAAQMRVEIVFVDDSWVEIRDGERNVQFSGTVPAGSTRSFEARPPLDVVIGNARGVRITYNDKPFDVAAHAARNIARFRLE